MLTFNVIVLPSSTLEDSPANSEILSRFSFALGNLGGASHPAVCRSETKMVCFAFSYRIRIS